jgi:NMD protein affecting ribosome stability and mRNA decay
MVYIISYKVGSSEEIKLAQIESDDVISATKKTKNLFSELELIGRRKYTFIGVVRLSEIRKLDALS